MEKSSMNAAIPAGASLAGIALRKSRVYKSYTPMRLTIFALLASMRYYGDGVEK
jgi:hypothetical protein